MRFLAVAGLLLETCFLGMVGLHDLRQHTIPFLILQGLAFLVYGVATYRLIRNPAQRRAILTLVLILSVLFRATLLFTTPPTLSDDVYRYIWDGRLANAGVSPYTYPVSSPLLDPFDSPQRDLVNNDWMASPYLPVAQVFFAVLYRLAPDSPLAFQVAAALLDLLTGLLVIDLLRRLDLPQERALIYLWNPLVVVEFAHGAHVDALMICLTMAALWVLVAARSAGWSAVALAAATLTKGLPALLLPTLVWRWGWRRTAAYAALVVVACVPFALGAGLGLDTSLEGTGLFGAIRIYATFWDYNGGLYHWLRVGLSGLLKLAGAPVGFFDWSPAWAAKLITGMALGLVLLVVWWRARSRATGDLALLRLVLVPLTAYLLLTTTVHPWYVAFIVLLLPFLLAKKVGATHTQCPANASPLPDGNIHGATTRTGHFLLPGLYFSAVVSLSYLTYLDPANLREYELVRFVEYVPLYLLLAWAAWPASASADTPGKG